MKRIVSAIALTAIALSAFAQPQLRNDNIDEVLKAMTLEEKATLSVGGARAAIVNGVTSGAINEVPGAAGNTRPIHRLGIPNTVLADGPAGLRISPTREGTEETFYCTGFPIGTLMASSWDLDLMKEVTSAMGNEVLEYGVDVLLAPGINLHRNPLCGRNFEYYSEDPLLSGAMAAAFIQGVQSNGVGVSVKHFAGNDQETNRNENDAIINQRALRELYLKNFEIAIKNGRPWTVMSSYNKINGSYTQQSHDLLTTILRNEWGYDGIVMTDWGAKEGTVDAVKAGNDLMEPGNEVEIERIIAAVKDGSLPEEDLDRNVRRILEFIVKTPNFKGYKHSDKPDLKAHAEVARKAADEAIVLLKNEDSTLPLKGKGNVALYGITSLDFVAGGTGSGNVNKAYVVNMEEAFENAGFTLDADLMDFYHKSYDYTQAYNKMSGVSNWILFGNAKLQEVEIPASAIKAQAARNDVAVVVIGRNAGEGADRTAEDFELSAIERELIYNVSSEFHQAGKKVIVILNIGGVIETYSWKNLADAILLPWSPGQEGANAVLDILTGKVTPSGKLPMTFPVNFFDHPSSHNFPLEGANAGRTREPFWGNRNSQARKNVDYTKYNEGIWVGYRYFDTADKDVSFPFGFGLSYTTFTYSKPTAVMTKNGYIAVSVTVTNTGNVAGKEVVEVYVSAPAGGLEKPEKELKSFGKTKELKPGESQTLMFSIHTYDLASFNEEASRWETAAGKYNFQFGANIEDIKASTSINLKAYGWEVNNVMAPSEKLEPMAVK